MQENCTKAVYNFFILALQHLSSQFPLTTHHHRPSPLVRSPIFSFPVICSTLKISLSYLTFPFPKNAFSTSPTFFKPVNYPHRCLFPPVTLSPLQKHTASSLHEASQTSSTRATHSASTWQHTGTLCWPQNLGGPSAHLSACLSACLSTCIPTNRIRLSGGRRGEGLLILSWIVTNA